MNQENKNEIVNAARSYERIVAERREIFIRTIRLTREGRKDEAETEKKAYYNSKGRALAAERLLADRIYYDQDFVRVDDVVYMAYSTETILRIPLKDILTIGDSATHAEVES